MALASHREPIFATPFPEALTLMATTIRSSSVEIDGNRRFMDHARGFLAGGDSSTTHVVPHHLPLVADRGSGSRIWDIDGNDYIDLNMAFGSLLLGHRPPQVIDAVTRQISERGSQLGFPTEISVRVAAKIRTLFPSMELMRFANSGTEACNLAARLARTITGRSKIVVFEGNCHGWSDPLFHRYHAPLAELPQEPIGPAIAGTRGMNGEPRDLVVVRSNDHATLEDFLRRHGQSVAAVILEPIMCNAGCIPPRPDFLKCLRAATRDQGTLLVFDEVITGLRVAPGGAQELYGVKPDITVISKALGAGFPLAACGASRDLMEAVAIGRVIHDGLRAGNAGNLAAADAVLDEILAHRDVIYAHLNAIGLQLARGLEDILTPLGVPHTIQQVGPIVSLFLTNQPREQLWNYREVRKHCDFDKYVALQHEMQRRGVYFYPNQLSPMYLSTAHTTEDVAVALQKFEDGVRQCLVN